MGSESEEKRKSFHGRKQRFGAVASFTIAIAFIMAVAAYWTQADQNNNDMVIPATKNTESSSSEQPSSPTAEEAVDLAKFEDCTISFRPFSKDKWTTKPLWLPSHPNSLEESIHKQIVNTLTGLDAGGKSFYASSRGMKLRHCFGETETATCSNVHPIVEMGKGGPDAKANQFFKKYIMAIRNPSTVLPAFHNGKAIKYHGLKGQIPQKDWRKHRDTYMQDMIEGWKLVLRTWKAMKSYQVGMYLVYEHLMDAQRGPAALRHLAGLLREAGFVVAPDEDIPCIWYKAMGRRQLEQYQKYKYEYQDYVPGYTKAQKEMLMRELSGLMAEYRDDPELVAVLKEYHDDIRDHVRSDRE